LVLTVKKLTTEARKKKRERTTRVLKGGGKEKSPFVPSLFLLGISRRKKGKYGRGGEKGCSPFLLPTAGAGRERLKVDEKKGRRGGGGKKEDPLSIDQSQKSKKKGGTWTGRKKGGTV